MDLFIFLYSLSQPSQHKHNTELSSQDISFHEDVDSLTLLSILPSPWEISCTTQANTDTKTLETTTSAIITKDVRHQAMQSRNPNLAKAHDVESDNLNKGMGIGAGYNLGIGPSSESTL